MAKHSRKLHIMEEEKRTDVREYTIGLEGKVMELRKLSFSSSELMSLGTCLPLVLLKFVNYENSHNHAHFILLFEIMSSLQCYSFTELELSKLERNIEIHNSIFCVDRLLQNFIHCYISRIK